MTENLNKPLQEPSGKVRTLVMRILIASGLSGALSGCIVKEAIEANEVRSIRDTIEEQISELENVNTGGIKTTIESDPAKAAERIRAIKRRVSELRESIAELKKTDLRLNPELTEESKRVIGKKISSIKTSDIEKVREAQGSWGVRIFKSDEYGEGLSSVANSLSSLKRELIFLKKDVESLEDKALEAPSNNMVVNFAINGEVTSDLAGEILRLIVVIAGMIGMARHELSKREGEKEHKEEAPKEAPKKHEKRRPAGKGKPKSPEDAGWDCPRCGGKKTVINCCSKCGYNPQTTPLELDHSDNAIGYRSRLSTEEKLPKRRRPRPKPQEDENPLFKRFP